MKTNIFTLIGVLVSFSAFSQVGINTTTPTATLDVNGTMKLRQTPAAPALSGYQILAVNLNSGGDFQVAQVDPQLIIDGITINANTNASVYAAKKSAGISLLSLALFPTGFRAVNFLAAERSVGSAALFSDTDNTYTIPSNGIYAIGYSFRYGTGLQASILANSPGIGILRNRAGVGTIIDSRAFSGANLILLSLTISETSINSLYTFQAGDKISFGLTGSTALDVGLLGSSVGSFYIYKVSN
ncbi:hypothetical protein ACM39_13690 [Chryseobacterium sp. FH2]|uniref:hypothetical protein n=1 Tax=Chryseobacterium sp. FH2 TaxID=1674291 RepID=UPI00065AC9FF|nr:hypothetical protein [Chryseobacterium sp. FH2]KMQ67483.1 hypothetical protein ACM39_13690 [Chryseobacterium sp. FH2]